MYTRTHIHGSPAKHSTLLLYGHASPHARQTRSSRSGFGVAVPSRVVFVFVFVFKTDLASRGVYTFFEEFRVGGRRGSVYVRGEGGAFIARSISFAFCARSSDVSVI